MEFESEERATTCDRVSPPGHTFQEVWYPMSFWVRSAGSSVWQKRSPAPPSSLQGQFENSFLPTENSCIHVSACNSCLGITSLKMLHCLDTFKHNILFEMYLLNLLHKDKKTNLNKTSASLFSCFQEGETVLQNSRNGNYPVSLIAPSKNKSQHPSSKSTCPTKIV